MHRLPRFVVAAALATTLATSIVACGHPPTIEVHTGAADAGHALTSTGSATLAVAPDCADLSLTITANAARPGQAFATARAREDALVGALEHLGIARADLALSQLGVDPVYRDDGGRAVLDGFRAHVTITATTRAFDRIGPLMEAAADAGVTEMSNRFRRSDLAALRAKVRTEALAAAQAKAAATAATLGLHLGRIIAVSDASPSYLSSNEYFPSSGGGAGGLAAEQQPLTVDVTLTYDI
jgi:uncharacterized protein YggE